MLTKIRLPPWTNDDMINQLKHFHDLWANRPIANNIGGMRSTPMFQFWFTLQYLKPKIIIESGVFRGLGTYFIQLACPEAQVFCIEPRQDRIRYRHKNAMYFTQDFSKIPWDKYISQSNFLDVLFFIDDHQNDFSRIPLCQELGIKHILLEDNYAQGTGDCYTLKKAFENEEDSQYLHNVLEIYSELPPVYKGEQWRGEPWNHPTSNPLLTKVEYPYQQVFYDEQKEYTWFAYAKLKG